VQPGGSLAADETAIVRAFGARQHDYGFTAEAVGGPARAQQQVDNWMPGKFYPFLFESEYAVLLKLALFYFFFS